MSIDHRSLFKVFLLASLATVVLWLIELPFDIIRGPEGFMVYFIYIPLALAFLIAITLVSAIIGHYKNQKISRLRYALYLTIMSVLVSLVAYMSWLVNRGIVD